MVIISAKPNSIAQTTSFHHITFDPSSELNGKRLNVASKALTKQMDPTIHPKKEFSKKTNRKKGNVTAAIMIFAADPAAAILPISKGLGSPLKITEPGAAKITPVNTASIDEKMRLSGNILNSDQSPYLCAINL